MKIAFVTIGRHKFKECETLVQHYLKLAGKFASIETVELQPSRSANEESAQNIALSKWFEKRGTRAHLTLLDEKGSSFTSRELSARIEKIRSGSHSEWIIVTAGARGFDESLKKRANLLWSLSPLTFAHEIAAVVAAEQIFRALSILNKHPYHNE
ncbi:MAG: 23S rRNA (pseudouridine(1915)-N(3))-methyltransferase RlmH [Bdellovibrionota bacterium]